MPGPLKNSRHELFAQEYLTDLNAFRAAAACGIEFKFEGRGFYVYFLIDQRSGSIFYVGKGKGERLHAHQREAHSAAAINQVKAARLRDCGEHLATVIFSDDLDEVSAFRIEKDLIASLKHVGLTNISGGSVHPLESLLAGVDQDIGLIRPFDDWMATIRPQWLEAVIAVSGSPEAFYRDFCQRLSGLRSAVLGALNSISEKSNGTEGR